MPQTRKEDREASLLVRVGEGDLLFSPERTSGAESEDGERDDRKRRVGRGARNNELRETRREREAQGGAPDAECYLGSEGEDLVEVQGSVVRCGERISLVRRGADPGRMSGLCEGRRQYSSVPNRPALAVNSPTVKMLAAAVKYAGSVMLNNPIS